MVSSVTYSVATVAVCCRCAVLTESIDDVTGFTFGQVVDSHLFVENRSDSTFQLWCRESLTLPEIEQILNLLIGRTIPVGSVSIATVIRVAISVLGVLLYIVRRGLFRRG